MAVLGEDWQCLSVKSFDGGCYVKAHVPYKIPVSRDCCGGLAFGSACKKLLEDLLFMEWVYSFTHFILKLALLFVHAAFAGSLESLLLSMGCYKKKNFNMWELSYRHPFF